LARARAALDHGDRRVALDWYRRLRDHFPSDEAARTVLVTSGRLEMELGATSRALEDFEAYLRGGDGALEVEALAGTARAFRALGRVSEERRAIDRYLARFPNGFDAPLLRSRRAELAEPTRAHAIDPRR
jgi:tetratricopeptide (TPR) repeat protein